jgi:hypothetical protein
LCKNEKLLDYVSQTSFYIPCSHVCFGLQIQDKSSNRPSPEGRWITVDTLDFIYITKGKYHEGAEIGTWKYIYKNKMVRKEKYRNGICKTVFYYPNGKIMKKGITKLESTTNEDHCIILENGVFIIQMAS